MFSRMVHIMKRLCVDPLPQAAQLLLENATIGVILQSQIEPAKFLNGNYIARVYGKM